MINHSSLEFTYRYQRGKAITSNTTFATVCSFPSLEKTDYKRRLENLNLPAMGRYTTR